MNNVRQRRNNVVIFNVEFHNVGKRRNNVVKMTISKKSKKIISNRIHSIQSFNYYFIIFFTLLPMLRGICRKVLANTRKFLKVDEKYCIARTYFKPVHFVTYQLVFNFTRGLVEVHNDQQNFNLSHCESLCFKCIRTDMPPLNSNSPLMT